MMKNMKYVFALSLLFSTALRAENDNSDILAQLAALRAQVLELQKGQNSLTSEVAENTAWRQNVAGALRDAFLSTQAEFVEAAKKMAELESAGAVDPSEKEAYDYTTRVLEAIFGQTMTELFPELSTVRNVALVETMTPAGLASDDSPVLEQAVSDQTSKDEAVAATTEGTH